MVPVEGVMKALVLAGLVILVSGCATAPIPGASRNLLGFLTDTTTTREQVILTLGQPSASFENDRILTYRIGQDPEQGQFVITPRLMLTEVRIGQPSTWQEVRYSLVLVFDAQGVLKQHKLVTVR